MNSFTTPLLLISFFIALFVAIGCLGIVLSVEEPRFSPESLFLAGGFALAWLAAWAMGGVGSMMRLKHIEETLLGVKEEYIGKLERHIDKQQHEIEGLNKVLVKLGHESYGVKGSKG